MPATNLNRIEFELFRNLVEMNFQRVTRLRCAVPAFWTTRRLVRKGAQPLELVTRHVIRDRLQRARVERTRNSIASVCTAIEKRLKVHRGDRAIVLHTRLHTHQHRMPATMTVKHLFARQRYFDRTTRYHRQLANHHFMVERIALAANAAAVWRRNHTNVTCRHSKDFRKRTMNVVRSLSRTPERDLSVRIEVSDRGVLLQRQVRVAFVEESV